MTAYVMPEGSCLYCKACAPDGADAFANGGGEADTPQHCDTCGLFLRNPLTSDGNEYVREAIERAHANGRVDSVALTEWAPFYGYEAKP